MRAAAFVWAARVVAVRVAAMHGAVAIMPIRKIRRNLYITVILEIFADIDKHKIIHKNLQLTI